MKILNERKLFSKIIKGISKVASLNRDNKNRIFRAIKQFGIVGCFIFMNLFNNKLLVKFLKYN